MARATRSGPGIRSRLPRVMFERMKPGETTEMETPLPSSCRRSESEKPRTPYFVAE